MLKDYFRAPSLTKQLRSACVVAVAVLAGCSGGGGSVGPTSVASQTVVPTQAPTLAPSATPTAQSSPTTTGLYLEADSPNQIGYVQTTLTVPAEPPKTGSLLVAPALGPINNPQYSGVIAPVLTWGPSCVAGNQPTAYSTWWVSAQYSTGGNEINDTGCQSGPIMPVNVSDSLLMTMLVGNSWTETILDIQSGQQVSYAVGGANENQNRISFSIEGNGQNLVSPAVFSNTLVRFTTPPVDGCLVVATVLEAPNDAFSTPVQSNGTDCQIANMTLFSPAGPVRSDRVRAKQPSVPASSRARSSGLSRMLLH